MRTHVILPTDLVEKIDARVGERGRSRFIAEATARELARLETLDAARAAAGALREGDVPAWDTETSTTSWLEELRRQDLARQERLEALRSNGDAPPP